MAIRQICKRFYCKTKIFEGLQSQKLVNDILEETKVTRAHLTPEIALHLITPECRLFFAPLENLQQTVFKNDPFWGFYWPGGQALTRYILDNAVMFLDKSVLDVGSGCGASSLAAIMCNAKYVIANDIDDAAGTATLLNADINKLPTTRLEICSENLIGKSVAEDVIILGDLFYDEEFVEILIPWLRGLRDDGKIILIGDPGRHGLTEQRLNFMQKLKTYEIKEKLCIENNDFKYINVWRFQ